MLCVSLSTWCLRSRQKYIHGERDLIEIRLSITSGKSCNKDKISLMDRQSRYQKTQQSHFLLSLPAVTGLCFFDSSPEYWSTLWYSKYGRRIEMYAAIIAREGPQTQVLQSTKVAWELMAVNDAEVSEAKDTKGFTKSQTTSLLIPTFVNNNHWMLCVARLPSATTSVRKIEYFSWLHSTFFSGENARKQKKLLDVLTTKSCA